MERTEATGDVDFPRRTNAEQAAQLRAVKQEEQRLKEDIEIMEGKINFEMSWQS